MVGLQYRTRTNNPQKRKITDPMAKNDPVKNIQHETKPQPTGPSSPVRTAHINVCI